jgi:cytochrome c
VKTFLAIGAVILGLVFSLPNGMAADHGSRDEAVAMVEKALALLAKDGPKAMAAFNDKNGGFVDRDLYIVVFDAKGAILAHGANNALIGVNLMEAKDPDGVPFIQEIMKSSREHPDGGWVTFKFTNPVTKKIGLKTSYTRAYGEGAINCGVYLD